MDQARPQKFASLSTRISEPSARDCVKGSTGFFRSINYAPQFYHVPHTMTGARELKIPKTLLELEGNHLFNFDPNDPEWGYHGNKRELPPDPLTWNGDKFFKDANGNYRFVYSGRDCQAGINVNAIILEIPLAFITNSPERDRIVNCWGESWVLKAANKIETIPDHPFWLEHPWALIDAIKLDDELKKYKGELVQAPLSRPGLTVAP